MLHCSISVRLLFLLLKVTRTCSILSARCGFGSAQRTRPLDTHRRQWPPSPYCKTKRKNKWLAAIQRAHRRARRYHFRSTPSIRSLCRCNGGARSSQATHLPHSRLAPRRAPCLISLAHFSRSRFSPRRLRKYGTHFPLQACRRFLFSIQQVFSRALTSATNFSIAHGHRSGLR